MHPPRPRAATATARGATARSHHSIVAAPILARAVGTTIGEPLIQEELLGKAARVKRQPAQLRFGRA